MDEMNQKLLDVDQPIEWKTFWGVITDGSGN